MIDCKSTETACNGTSQTQDASATTIPSHTPPLPTRLNRRARRQRTRQLAHDIHAICLRNPQGTQQAQTNRLRTLLLCAKLLNRRKKAAKLFLAHCVVIGDTQVLYEVTAVAEAELARRKHKH